MLHTQKNIQIYKDNIFDPRNCFVQKSSSILNYTLFAED